MRIETFAVLLLMWVMGIIGTVISRSFYALVLALVLGCVIIWASAGDEDTADRVRKPQKAPEPEEGEFLYRPEPIVRRADFQTPTQIVHHHHTTIEQRHLHLHANGQRRDVRVVEPKQITDGRGRR